MILGLGRPRHVPLLFLPWIDETGREIPNAWVVLGSRGGHQKHANWYINLLHNSWAEVSCGGVQVACQSFVLEGVERQSQWLRFTAMNPGFERYAGRVSRDIPVVLLIADKRENRQARY